MTKRDKAPKITMITERKIIDVQPAPLRGYPDRIEVDVCLTCAAIVFDVVHHDKWHQLQQNQ